jgi:hypothetical protein
MKINLSERQQVVTIILMAGATIFVLWLFLLAPLNSRRHQLDREIESMTTYLAQNNYLLGEGPLLTRKTQEEQATLKYQRQMEEIFSRLSMQPDRDALSNSVGRIEFMRALFGVRQRLRQKSHMTGIALPADIGMRDAVNSNEDARKLMLQLRAVEDAVDLALNLKIQTIRKIEPLPPIPRVIGAEGRQYLEEYPVRVNFYGTAENLYDLFAAILEPAHTFAVRNLRVEKALASQSNLLEINAVLSALVFSESAGAVPAAPVVRAVVPTGPKGY